ncbi:MAG: TadE/TadG family type IV pilus assembly protein [Cohaesibacteraceae bacterium]
MTTSLDNQIKLAAAAKPDDRWGFAKVGRRIAGFRSARRGVAATEFALIAPFMMALWLGSAELTAGLSADRKVSAASSTLADLVTQQTNLTPAEMGDIMDATIAIMMPFDTADLSIEIAGIRIDGDGATEVIWSDSRGTGAPSIGGEYAIPEELARPDSFLVAAHLRYAYMPPTVHTITGTLELTDSFFLRPRRSDEISYNP